MRLLFREAQIELGIMLLSVHRLTNRIRPFAVWNKVRVKPCPGGAPDRHLLPRRPCRDGGALCRAAHRSRAGDDGKFAERVKVYGESRLVCGFHYPTDLVAGDKVGRAVAKALLADRAFRARFDETLRRDQAGARAEIAQAAASRRFASIWPIASTTASKVSMVEAWRAL